MKHTLSLKNLDVDKCFSHVHWGVLTNLQIIHNAFVYIRTSLTNILSSYLFIKPAKILSLQVLTKIDEQVI